MHGRTNPFDKPTTAELNGITVSLMSSLNQKPADPERFSVSKGTLRVDGFMNRFIKIGGIGIIVAVFGIFIFILWQVIPLFSDAKVRQEAVVQTGLKEVSVLGADEWGVLPFVANADGGTLNFSFIDLSGGEAGKPALGERGIFTRELALPQGESVSALRYHHTDQTIIVGTDKGRYATAAVRYRPVYAQDGARTIEAETRLEAPVSLGEGLEDARVTDIDTFDAERLRMVAAIVRHADGTLALPVAAYTRRATPFGVGPWQRGQVVDLIGQIDGTPKRVLVNGQGNGVLIATEGGHVYFFIQENNQIVLRQVFAPFPVKSEGNALADATTQTAFTQSASVAARAIGSMDWVLGNQSLVFTAEDGQNVIFSPYVDEASGVRIYGQTKEFPNMVGAADIYSPSLRNRCFFIASGSEVSLRYSTAATVRWEDTLDYAPLAGILGARYQSLFLMDAQGGLHVYSVDDPHPEASMSAFFSKIWYEGQNQPAYIWQSTGGSSDNEPKLSMVPLIVGSLKGTFYALIFAIPIALFSALYTSQFLRPEYKKVVKPTMEIMASLPSVVLGFLGALWLAPLIETYVPSLLTILVLVPVAALVVGFCWGKLPQRIRMLVATGQEFFLFIPVLVLVVWGGWQMGAWIETWFFTVKDPATGMMVGDFRLWWQQFSGMPFEQRNSMVVGFMMGFAVIPIIFTISEDALSNVPNFLTSASLALGASRWQTAWRIILPTASPGIFSAIMIGFGRAVGETMIVVMATGNTPIMDWDIFNGMRTLSANIAVELPEAPVHGTLYRTLFFGALLLFLLTFVVNTVAEVTRVRLRNKYKTVG